MHMLLKKEMLATTNYNSHYYSKLKNVKKKLLDKRNISDNNRNFCTNYY